jgi:23S rRNA (pseudouridine1915-N3)-methyltransferase
MKILLIFTGKTSEKYLDDTLNNYINRIRNYMPIEVCYIRESSKLRKSDIELIKKHEANEIIKNIESSDYVILLDEKGKTFSSTEFAQFINMQINRNVRRLVFIIGGPYGFSDIMYQHAHIILSLSPMTFTHQMVRLILVEQIYRAFTILKGEPYHH